MQQYVNPGFFTYFIECALCGFPIEHNEHAAVAPRRRDGPHAAQFCNHLLGYAEYRLLRRIAKRVQPAIGQDVAHGCSATEEDRRLDKNEERAHFSRAASCTHA